MRKDKKIILFSDLEGTILRESDGEYDKEAMYAFLTQIDILQQLTNANVNIHLVSPIYRKQMEEMIDKIDKDIVRYNRLHQDHDGIPMIECGTFTPERGVYEPEFTGDTVMPLIMPIDSRQFDTSRYGKAHYVKTWYDMYEKSGKLLTAIYCGNGQNDLSAIQYIKEKRGFIVCPKNSRTEAKKKADVVSERTDLSGITEGIAEINKKIAERVAPQPENSEQDGQEQ